MGWIQKLIHKITNKRKVNIKNNKEISQLHLQPEGSLNHVKVELQKNLDYVKDALENDSDLITGKFTILGGTATAGIVYLKGMVGEDDVSKYIISRLMDGNPSVIKNTPKSRWIGTLRSHLIASINMSESSNMEQLIIAIIAGNAALFINGIDKVMIVNMSETKARSIDMPESESSLNGAKDSFVEDIITNSSLIRKRLSSPQLRFKEFSLGRISRTKVRVCWIAGISEPKLVDEICRRIVRIDVDCISTVHMIAEFIEDKPLSIWPQHKKTERPDVVAGNLAEGRIAILCDGFPFVLIFPILILQELQSIDDYAEKPVMATFLRLTRYIALFTSTLISPLYLSFVSYNHTIIPPSLAMQIATGRENVPFPSIVEMLIMTFFIDLLREAGIRLPKAVGNAISILGAVVIGQAAVAAGYFSASLIIIVSVSAISAFAIQSTALVNASRLSNYLLIFLAAISGIFGVVLGVLFLIWEITTIRSMGILISHPVDTGRASGFKDLLIRAPFWKLRKRPEVFATDNDTRIGNATRKPAPPKKQKEDNKQ